MRGSPRSLWPGVDLEDRSKFLPHLKSTITPTRIRRAGADADIVVCLPSANCLGMSQFSDDLNQGPIISDREETVVGSEVDPAEDGEENDAERGKKRRRRAQLNCAGKSHVATSEALLSTRDSYPQQADTTRRVPSVEAEMR